MYQYGHNRDHSGLAFRRRMFEVDDVKLGLILMLLEISNIGIHDFDVIH